MDNEFLQRRRELDVPGAMRAANLAEYDNSMVVPMFGYRDVEVLLQTAVMYNVANVRVGEKGVLSTWPLFICFCRLRKLE